VRFQCSHCQGILAIEDVEAGEPVLCGHCGGVALVPPSRFSPGAVIADFVIQNLLGEGRLGRVFRVLQLSLERPAVLRILPEHLATSPDFAAAFTSTARTAARVEHPGLVQMYEVGEEEGTIYAAAEYAPGPTLLEVIRHSGRVVPERAAQILAAVAEALAAGHAACGLAHGAVTPTNIILHDQGSIKLADYGVVRPAVDVDVAGTSWLPLAPEYMAPEQTLGRPSDFGTDVYNLGASIYHAVTGRPPVEGTDPLDIVRRHRTQIPADPRTYAPEIPERFALLLLRMLAPSPRERYGDLNEVLAALAETGLPPESKTVEKAKAGPTPPKPSGARTRRTIRRRRSASQTDQGARSAGPVGETAAAAVPPASPPPVSMPPAGGRPGETGKSSGASSGLPESGAPPEQQPLPVRQRKWKLITFAAGLLLLVCIFGILAVLRWAGPPEGEAELGEALETEEAVPQMPAEVAAAVQDIQRRLQADGSDMAILADIARFQQRYPEQEAAVRRLLSAAEPLIEKEVRDLRRQKHEEELAAWRQTAKRLKEEARKREEEQHRRQQEEEQRRREREEQERLARLREERWREFEKKKKELRWKAVELCRKSQFLDAKLLFAPLCASREKDVRKWADAKRQCIDLAEKTWELIADSGETLKGERIPVPGRPRRAVIEYIGARSVSAVFKEKEYGPDGSVVRRNHKRAHPDSHDGPQRVRAVGLVSPHLAQKTSRRRRE